MPEKNKKPYLGICFRNANGSYKFTRNVLGHKDANSEEFNLETTHPVIHIMEEQNK